MRPLERTVPAPPIPFFRAGTIPLDLAGVRILHDRPGVPPTRDRRNAHRQQQIGEMTTTRSEIAGEPAPTMFAEWADRREPSDNGDQSFARAISGNKRTTAATKHISALGEAHHTPD
jgi:hypothetical protein